MPHVVDHPVEHPAKRCRLTAAQHRAHDILARLCARRYAAVERLAQHEPAAFASRQPDDLDAIGWDDYLDSGDAMAVEWPERAGGELPPRAIFVDIRIGDAPDERRFHVTAPDAP